MLVCGGRKYNDYSWLKQHLDRLHLQYEFDLVIHGGATGADTLAGMWAIERGVHVARVPALWEYYGKSAGARRNTAMLNMEPELVVAFPGGRGTADMVKQARGRRISVIEIEACFQAS